MMPARHTVMPLLYMILYLVSEVRKNLFDCACEHIEMLRDAGH